MKIVSFRKGGIEGYGIFHEEEIYDFVVSGKQFGLDFPMDILSFLREGRTAFDKAEKLNGRITNGDTQPENRDNLQLIAPVPHPVSCRDGYAFRQHVFTARRNRGAQMIPEFDQFPVFYFTNHNAIFGEGDIPVEEDHLQKLDFELEAAVVIGKKGRNISAAEADEYIAGYMIMNDFSARTLQMEEMKLSLGPAKGKDFATAVGPWLVTPDELDNYLVSSVNGNKYGLSMTAKHNGKLVSNGNLKDMNWSFAEIIERVSYGVDIYPGEIIGSGTVGTGCYLELNGTRALEARNRHEAYSPIWLQDGDTIELEITGLGALRNRIVKTSNNYSIIRKKKKTDDAF